MPPQKNLILLQSKKTIQATGEYSNWEGVSNISEFKDPYGNFCFAYKQNKTNLVYVYSVENEKITKKANLKIRHGNTLGAVTEDSKGNYYLVTGESNSGDDTSKNTIWISKYDPSSNYVIAVGDNGSSSIYSFYETGFYTKTPFDAGNCDVAVNGNLLSVNYARSMYSGHQSNSVLTINTDTMQKQTAKGIYNSHSFGQRVSAYQDGFIYASEGDCYPRAFTIDYVSGSADTSDDYFADHSGHITNDIFHFWVRPNALNDWNMYDVNDNFAHIGDLVNINDERAAFIGTSATKLDSTAKKEKEQLFIQIFNPTVDLSSGTGFFTSGVEVGRK